MKNSNIHTEDVLLKIETQLKNIDEYDPEKTIVGKWMSLIIS